MDDGRFEGFGCVGMVWYVLVADEEGSFSQKKSGAKMLGLSHGDACC